MDTPLRSKRMRNATPLIRCILFAGTLACLAMFLWTVFGLAYAPAPEHPVGLRPVTSGGQLGDVMMVALGWCTAAAVLGVGASWLPKRPHR